MRWTFKKKDATKMADFHTNEGKTQSSKVDFLKDEREKDATRIGGLSKRKTQQRWRTLQNERKTQPKMADFQRKRQGKDSTKMADFHTREERHNQSRWTFGRKDAAKMADFHTREERRNQRWRTFN